MGSVVMAKEYDLGMSRAILTLRRGIERGI